MGWSKEWSICSIWDIDGLVDRLIALLIVGDR